MEAVFYANLPLHLRRSTETCNLTGRADVYSLDDVNARTAAGVEPPETMTCRSDAERQTQLLRTLENREQTASVSSEI